MDDNDSGLTRPDDAGLFGHIPPPPGVNDKSPPPVGAEPSFTASLGPLWPKTTTVRGTIDERIAWVADRQRGLVARAQLLAVGVSATTIDRLIGRQRLRRVHPGVYVYGHRASVPLQDETAAILALRDGAVLSHRTAATLWDLQPPAKDGIHALVLGNGSAGRLRSVTVHRTVSLNGDRRRRERLPVTGPLRTVLDMATEIGGRPLELLVDRAVVQHSLDLTRLRQRCRGRRGCAELGEILDSWEGPTLTRSQAEEMFLALVRKAGLPAPRVNRHHGSRERDFRWPDARVIVEVDGYRYHGTRRRFEQDRRRDTSAVALGLQTLRFSFRQVSDEPLAVTAAVATALSGRSSPYPS
jgi:very-short-patch-repair endonuclease